MNLKRGLTRLWIAGSCVWIAHIAFWAYEQHKPMGSLDAKALERLAKLEARPNPFEQFLTRPQPSQEALQEALALTAQAQERANASKRWDAARIGAFLSAVLTSGILPAAQGFAGLFVLMQLTRWIAAGFRGGLITRRSYARLVWFRKTEPYPMRARAQAAVGGLAPQNMGPSVGPKARAPTVY